jgi:hypothetical protein
MTTNLSASNLPPAEAQISASNAPEPRALGSVSTDAQAPVPVHGSHRADVTGAVVTAVFVAGGVGATIIALEQIAEMLAMEM